MPPSIAPNAPRFLSRIPSTVATPLLTPFIPRHTSTPFIPPIEPPSHIPLYNRVYGSAQRPNSQIYSSFIPIPSHPNSSVQLELRSSRPPIRFPAPLRSPSYSPSSRSVPPLNPLPSFAKPTSSMSIQSLSNKKAQSFARFPPMAPLKLQPYSLREEPGCRFPQMEPLPFPSRSQFPSSVSLVNPSTTPTSINYNFKTNTRFSSVGIAPHAAKQVYPTYQNHKMRFMEEVSPQFSIATIQAGMKLSVQGYY